MTTCKYCPATFDGGVEIIGQPGARLEKLVQTLGAHLDAKHQDVEQTIGADVGAFAGLLFLMSFKTTDEALNARRDQLRWRAHQLTLNARYSDESLTAQCRDLSRRLVDCMDSLDRASEGMVAHEDLVRSALELILLEVFTGMRDALEEPNRYPVVHPAVAV